MVGLPFPIMLLVDVDRGRAEGIALARELQDGGKTTESEDVQAQPVYEEREEYMYVNAPVCLFRWLLTHS